MQYLCLICAEQMMEHLDEADAERHFGECAVFTYGIKRNGHFVAANRLTPPGAQRGCIVLRPVATDAQTRVLWLDNPSVQR